MILIFEGMDKTGKTTLIHEINKITKFKPLIIDRGTIGYSVYDYIYKRGRSEYYSNLESQMLNVNHLVVYCKCDKELIEKRLKQCNEQFPKEQKSIEYVLNLYDEFIGKSKMNILELDTGKYTIEECVNKILERMD